MKTSRKQTGRQGFTLIEVLVVMAILALMAGMVMPRVLGRQKSANLDAAKTQIDAFRGALDQYALDMNSYPSTEQGLAALAKEPDSEEDGPKGNWRGPYLGKNSVPKDPWGSKYEYEYPSERFEGKEPAIWSFGPDGIDDTEDDILSWTKTSEDGEEMDDEEDLDDESGDDMDAGDGGGDEL